MMKLRNNLNKLCYFFFGALTAAAVMGGYGYFQRNAYLAANNNSRTIDAVITPTVQADNVKVDFSDIAAQQGPSVVNVSVSGRMRVGFHGALGIPQPDLNAPFQDFFKRFHPPTNSENIPTHGLGSGFIVDSNGVILTNAHVIVDAQEVSVTLSDRREFKAKVIGTDPLSDVAVLKIDAKDLPAVKIGNPKVTRVGEWVVAIGSPFGFENTVTAGIISAKSRTLPREGYVPFLQTDVAINPGNSGGPLFNLSGEVIGINSQIYSNTGGSQGLSFAIPIDVAMKVERQLVETGKVRRGWLGVSIQDLSTSWAAKLGMDKPAGAFIGSVEHTGPAEKAGIEPGDVVLKLDGNEIHRSGELPPLVANMAPGTKADITVLRQKKTMNLSVTVGEFKPPLKFVPNPQ
jgi:serine protease Do